MTLSPPNASDINSPASDPDRDRPTAAPASTPATSAYGVGATSSEAVSVAVTKQTPRRPKPKLGFVSMLVRLATQAVAVTAILTALTTLVGAAWAVWQFAEAKRMERAADELRQKAEELRELTTFGTFAEFVKTYRSIALETDHYMQMIRHRHMFSFEGLEDLFEKYETGSSIYYSDEFVTFRRIHEFYDELGLQVKKGALDFSLVFDLVTFPSDFAEETAPLCDFIGRNWFGRNKAIAGMCDNTFYLWERYCHLRKSVSVLKIDATGSECYVGTAPAVSR